MDRTKVEYVIYCRKSSDESSDNQKQSIPDQIKKCIEYADREWLTLKNKPKNFEDFETLSDISNEDNESDLNNRRILQDSRKYFIIKEEKTWKIPWARKKWANLIKWIKAGKINGVISYSPDRQARNMVDGWQLIDLVDQNKLKENKQKQITVLDLKYTNFHFEDNAAGKMMLWIWFVFSKQYSDKLWEDIGRWNASKVEWGKAIGRPKYWYFVNDKGYHEPHEKHFPLIQEAFEMKLNNVAEIEIKDFLDANGLVREYKKEKWRTSTIGINTLNKLFKDEFYYWMFINGEAVSDLRETNEYYRPAITEEQHQIIIDRHRSNPITKWKSKVSDEHDEIRSFENDFIISEDNFHFTFSLPNPKRHKDKIQKAWTQWRRLLLKEIVQTHQIQYICANKNSKQHKMSVTQADIDVAIDKALKYFKVSEEAFKSYVEFCKKRLDEIDHTTKWKVSSKNLEIWRVKAKRKKYIQDNMSIKKDKEEEKIYEDTKKEYDRKINILRKEIEWLDEWERDETLEIEIFMDVLNNAREYYRNANYVQKGKIWKILFLNIKITHEKRLLIQPKAGLETLFTHHWWS